MNTMATSGFGNGALDSLAIATDHGRTRCVNAENPTGGKGTAATAASALGPSRKGSPCIQTIKAGDSVTLMDVDGPGVIRHIWMTVTDRTSPTGPNVLRNLILEFYWDGEETPSVQCPIGDFFCCGHAQACRINSIPIMVVPNRGFNCYFAMPFEHARIVLRNDHNEDVPAFFYQAMPHVHHHIMRIVEIDAMLTSQQQFPTRLAFMTNDVHMVRIDGLRHVTFQTCHSRAIGTVPQTRQRKRSIQYRTHASHTAKRSRMFKRFDKFACRHHRTNSM